MLAEVQSEETETDESEETLSISEFASISIRSTIYEVALAQVQSEETSSVSEESGESVETLSFSEFASISIPSTIYGVALA